MHHSHRTNEYCAFTRVLCPALRQSVAFVGQPSNVISAAGRREAGIKEKIMAYDLLIKNGRVVDGSGEPAFVADVAVEDGKIVGVGKYAGATAKRIIDAEGH